MNTILNKVACLAIVLSCSSSVLAEKGTENRRGHSGPPAFSSLDLDGSGAIDLNEFSQHKIPRGDHDTLFDQIDADGDGLIFENELESHVPPRHKKQKRDET